MVDTSPLGDGLMTGSGGNIHLRVEIDCLMDRLKLQPKM
jgi:hypothetical protein